MIHLKTFLHADTLAGLLPDGWETALNELILAANKKLIALNHIDEASVEIIEVNFQSNDQIAEVNKNLRSIDSPTDVLSLRLTDSLHNNEIPNLPEEVFGEIYISLEKCQEQADEIGQSFITELTFLTLHGILHIFNYDHMTPEEEEEMMSIAYEILRRT
ncbi:MAG: rRNA maturation RNase YbeY [Candidatus Peregrinibacteria bacterium]|nr:rRNA maturation RNase YbeY [Candidatus Peregrinibacteria bacterium]MDZ4245165.1 rRNA maturation RNase YbeY [Candidatus Gracilibacteria bacterium]